MYYVCFLDTFEMNDKYVRILHHFCRAYIYVMYNCIYYIPTKFIKSIAPSSEFETKYLRKQTSE